MKSRINKNRKITVFRKAGIIALSMIYMLSLIGCRINDNAKEKSSKVEKKSDNIIVVGVDRFEPYSYLDENGNYTGIDIELAGKAFGELGYEPEFQVIPWEDKDEYLANGTIDCIWSCYSMTDREEKYEWAGPYMKSRQVVVVRSDSDIYTLDDLENKRIGVQTTTKAENLFLHVVDSELPDKLMVNSFSSTDEIFAVIRKNYVDAISGHEALLAELVDDGAGAFRMLDESPYVSEIGVAFEKGTHKELAESLKKVLDKMAEDGTTGEIADKYGLDPEKTVLGGYTDEK